MMGAIKPLADAPVMFPTEYYTGIKKGDYYEP